MKKLIVKFLTNSITGQELENLKRWLKNPENQEVFKQMVRANHRLDDTYRFVDVETACKKLMKSISEQEKPRFTFVKTFKYAATVAIIVSSVVAFLTLRNNDNPSSSNTAVTKDTSSQIVLELEDGTTQVLDSRQQRVISNNSEQGTVAQSFDRLTYSKGDKLGDKLVFNSLKVPFGKRFGIELSDGTKVFLNAGSKLRYPKVFNNPLNREVYLDGEALFEVTSNASQPFIVHTEKMNVKVLGTKFNVSSYKNDDRTSTVLVEGSVGIYLPSESFNDGDGILIAPNEQAYIQSEEEIYTRKVNVQKHIAWINGTLYFVNDRFANIMKELERHFNLEIVNNYPELNNTRYTGTFFESQTIEQVLNTFKRNTEFDYTKQGNKIIIESSLR